MQENPGSSDTRSAPQTEQTWSPGLLNCDARHVEHAVAPLVDWNVPALHVSQARALGMRENDPGEHGRHEEAPIAGW